jgi:hypothetical protein
MSEEGKTEFSHYDLAGEVSHRAETSAAKNLHEVAGGRWLPKLERHMKEHEGQLAIVALDGQISVEYRFGQEAEDSPMAGGASYGVADTIGDALAQVMRELRLGDGEEKP